MARNIARPRKPSFIPIAPLGRKRVVLGREPPFGGTQGVVVEAVNGQADNQGDGKHIAAGEANAMCSLLIPGGHGCSCDGGVSAHCLATCSSVSTENLL